eukprot:15484608-Alexandrium_andersonii.AAC.1
MPNPSDQRDASVQPPSPRRKKAAAEQQAARPSSVRCPPRPELRQGSGTVGKGAPEPERSSAERTERSPNNITSSRVG